MREDAVAVAAAAAVDDLFLKLTTHATNAPSNQLSARMHAAVQIDLIIVARNALSLLV
jgi:hypothetical protein